MGVGRVDRQVLLMTAALNWLMSSWTGGRSGAKARTIATFWNVTFFSKDGQLFSSDELSYQVGRRLLRLVFPGEVQDPPDDLPAAEVSSRMTLTSSSYFVPARSPRSRLLKVRTPVRGLLISWAIPDASRPTMPASRT